MIHRFTYACLIALLIQSLALAQNTQKTDNGLRVSGETSKLEAAEPELSSDFSPEDLELRSNDGRGTALIPAETTQASEEQDAAINRIPEPLDTMVPERPDNRRPSAPNSSRQHLVDILKGKVPEDWPKEEVNINLEVRESHGRTFFRQTTLNPQSENLTMDQRREIFLSLNLAKIRDYQQRLSGAGNETEKKKILANLKSEYAARFEIDTAFQELKLEEIERRASKLRAEVNKRSDSQDEWVNAMVTLDKMRANGFDTTPASPSRSMTPSLVPPFQPQANQPRSFGRRPNSVIRRPYDDLNAATNRANTALRSSQDFYPFNALGESPRSRVAESDERGATTRQMLHPQTDSFSLPPNINRRASEQPASQDRSDRRLEPTGLIQGLRQQQDLRQQLEREAGPRLIDRDTVRQSLLQPNLNPQSRPAD